MAQTNIDPTANESTPAALGVKKPAGDPDPYDGTSAYGIGKSLRQGVNALGNAAVKGVKAWYSPVDAVFSGINNVATGFAGLPENAQSNSTAINTPAKPVGLPAAKPSVAPQPTQQQMIDQQNTGMDNTPNATSPIKQPAAPSIPAIGTPRPTHQQSNSTRNVLPVTQAVQPQDNAPDIQNDVDNGNVPAYVAYGSNGIQAGYTNGNKIETNPLANGQTVQQAESTIPGIGAFSKSFQANNKPLYQPPTGSTEMIRGMNRTDVNAQGKEVASGADGGQGLRLNQDAARANALLQPFRDNATGAINPQDLVAGAHVTADATNAVTQEAENERNQASIAGGITREGMSDATSRANNSATIGGENFRANTPEKQASAMRLAALQDIASGDPVRASRGQAQLNAINAATPGEYGAVQQKTFDNGIPTGENTILYNKKDGSVITPKTTTNNVVSKAKVKAEAAVQGITDPAKLQELYNLYKAQ